MASYSARKPGGTKKKSGCTKSFEEQMYYRKRKQASGIPLAVEMIVYRMKTPIEQQKYITPKSYSRQLEYDKVPDTKMDDRALNKYMLKLAYSPSVE